MQDYVQSNKAAWEEAFDRRTADWGKDVVARISHEQYPFFRKETVRVLRKYDLAGKTIGQFCCNNGRETLSLTKSSGAKRGVGFDIAENQVDFANRCAKELALPCTFVATDVYAIEGCEDVFDFVLITIGALNWLKDLDGFFRIVAKSMKKGGAILINEWHPALNMLALEGEEGYDAERPLSIVYSYFEREMHSNQGMSYITGESYVSKTFIEYTHSLSEIMGALCRNGIVITNFEEYDHDIGVGCTELDGKRFPLSMIIEGRKLCADQKMGTVKENAPWNTSV